MKFGIINYRKKIGDVYAPIGLITINKNKFNCYFKNKKPDFFGHFEHYNCSSKIFVPFKYSKNDHPTAIRYYQYLREDNIALYSLSELKNIKSLSIIRKMFPDFF